MTPAVLLLAAGLVGEKPPAADGPAAASLLKPGDRVAFVGGTFWEDERRDGAIETALTLAVPGVTFRHLGWGGDMADQSARRFFGTAEDGREHLLEHVDVVDPTLIFVAYGAAESLPGGMPADEFEEHLNSLLDELETRADRVILVAPDDHRAAEYAMAVREVAGERGFEVIEEGALVASKLEHREARSLTDLIRTKNDLFLHRHRPQNETYLRGFRAHEQGANAAEIEKFEPLVAAKDAEIQALRGSILKETK